MRLYRVSMSGDFGDKDGRALWASNKADIPTLKKQIGLERDDVNTHCVADVEEVEFRTTKAGILDLLNKYADRA